MLKVPAGHVTQPVRAAELVVPGAHHEQFVEPDTLFEDPSGHLVHGAKPCTPTDPGRQVHRALAAVELEFSGHLLHEGVAGGELKVPAEHVIQLVMSASLVWPSEHQTHSERLGAMLTLPTAQATHGATPPAP